MSELAKFLKELEEGDELVFNNERLKFVGRIKTYTRSNMLFRFEEVMDYEGGKFNTSQFFDFSRKEILDKIRREDCYRVDENAEAEKHFLA